MRQSQRQAITDSRSGSGYRFVSKIYHMHGPRSRSWARGRVWSWSMNRSGSGSGRDDA